MKKLFYLSYFIVFLFFSGCAPIARNGQPQISNNITLEDKQSIGQTLVANYAGLTGIEVFLDPKGMEQSGSLRLYLRGSPLIPNTITQAELPLAQVSKPGYYRFTFPPISGSNQASYYFYLESISVNRIEVATAPGESYLNGSLYIDQKPADGQLTFRLDYDPVKMFTGLLSEGLLSLSILAASLFLFVLPGWALLSGLWPAWRDQNWIEKSSLSVGSSLAIYPILLLWTDLFDVHLGAFYAWAPPVIAILYLVWKNRKTKFVFPRFDWNSLEGWAMIASAIVLGLVIFVRVWVIRGLSVPMWGDSYHHTMIAQLIVENGGLFKSWAPYANLYGLTYHFGFHSLIAVLHWVTALSLPQATLWTGQLINIFAVLVLYPLAIKVGRSSWSGTVALLVAGLVSSMPMFYTNWGRYTQLAGQVILPIAIWLVWEVKEKLPKSVGAWVAIAIVWVGLALTHYRVFLLACCFLLILLIPILIHIHQIKRYTRFLISGAFGTILLLPWLYRGYSGKIMADVTNKLSTPAQAVADSIQQYNQVGSYTTYQSLILWLLLIVSVGIVLWKHEKKALFLIVWAALLLLVTNPGELGLPGDGIISNFALFIFAYFWSALLIGAGTGYLLEAVKKSRFNHHLLKIALLITIFIVSLSSLPSRMKDLQPQNFQLVTKADQRAFQWIKENTPQNARFLGNSIFAYGNSVIVGTDGGWWLPLLTGREFNVPPMMYNIEKPPFVDYVNWVNNLPGQIQSKGILNPDVIHLLSERGITHVYIGQRQGSVNYNGMKILDPEKISRDSHFNVVYHQDRIWIFSFKP